MIKKAIFLDRDGIVNKSIVREGKPYSPKDLNEFEFAEDIEEIKNLEDDFLIFIFTNQPEIARGKQSQENVEQIHKYICNMLPIKKIYTCPHDNLNNCDCRKPKSGMIFQAQKEFDLDLKNSWVIGDRWKDIDSGANAACRTIFVDYNYDEKLNCKPTYIVKSIIEAINIIRSNLNVI